MNANFFFFIKTYIIYVFIFLPLTCKFRAHRFPLKCSLVGKWWAAGPSSMVGSLLPDPRQGGHIPWKLVLVKSMNSYGQWFSQQSVWVWSLKIHYYSARTWNVINSHIMEIQSQCVYLSSYVHIDSTLHSHFLAIIILKKLKCNIVQHTSAQSHHLPLEGSNAKKLSISKPK